MRPRSTRSASALAAAAVSVALIVPGVVASTRGASPTSGLTLAAANAVLHSPRDGGRRNATSTSRPTGHRSVRAPRTLAAPAVQQAPRLATATPPASVVATSSGAPQLVPAKRAGLAHGDNADSTIEPPDPWIAVGPDHVVQVTNLRVRRTDRQGGHASTVNLFDFFNLPTAYPTWDADGRIVFDSVHKRWIAVELSYDCSVNTYPGDPATFGHGYVDLAVSRTADPNGTWDQTFAYADDYFLDYPSLGTSTDKVASGFNVYQMGPESSFGAGDCYSPSFSGASVAVWDWGQLLGSPADSYVRFVPFTGFSPRVALQTPAATGTLFVVGEAPTGGVRFETITGSVGTTTTTIAKSLDVDLTASGAIPGFATPIAPRQSGSPATIADGVDERPTDAVWRANRLAFVSTNTCTPPGDGAVRDCARLTELTTSSNAATAPTRRQDALIGQNGYDSFMPGVGYAGDGTIHVAWSRSSSGSFADSVASYQRTSDAVNSIADPAVVTAGVATYAGTRWGDYVGVAQDPQVPNAAWTANEYAAADGFWATTVARFQTAGLRYVPITPTRVLDSRSGLGIGGTAAKFQANTAKTFQVTNGGTIPNTARAVTGNVTVVNQTAAGWVGVTPTANNNPGSSTINFPVGDTRANNVIATLGGGRLSATYKAPSGSSTNLLFDVTGYYVDDSSQDRYFTLTPARFLDSRTNNGTTGKFQNLVPKPVQITGRNGVPATARAVTANLTVVNQTAAGWVAALSSNPANPASPGSSTLNFPLRDTRANGVTVQLDGSGRVWLDYKGATGATTDLILDISGYYAPATTGGLDYYPLNPGRLMDSRGANLSVLTGKFSNLIPRQVPTAGHWGVAADAKAVAGNLTVVNQTAGGFVADTPTSPGSSVPAISTLNFPVGDIRANGLVATLGSGSQWLDYKGTTGAKTDLIFDLSGYFR